MQVFISHSSIDTELAKRVAESLRQAGFDVWSDDQPIAAGEDWAAELTDALQESDAMVVLLTPDAVRSENVLHEIGYALGSMDYKGRLVPVIAAPPEELPVESIPWILRRLRTIRLRGQERDEEGFQQIARVLTQAA